MKNLTLDEAKVQLESAERSFLEIEAMYNEEAIGVPTAERVIRSVEIQAALREAAHEVVEAKDRLVSTKAAADARRMERAAKELIEVEALLSPATEDAEKKVDELASALVLVLDLSKKRYGYRQELTGRANRSLLARAAVDGWLQYRLASLELPELGRAPSYYRAPLSELLGIDGNTVINDVKEST